MTSVTAPSSAPPHTELREEPLEASEIKRRAAGGAVLVAVRGLGLQALSLGANIVLARLLVPRDFGLVAIGNTVIVFGDLMATSGAAATLIRSPTTPTLADLRAVMGFQLALTGAITAGTVTIALQFGRAGELAAVMSLGLPLLAQRSAPAVMLERSLEYRKLVSVEIVENLVYFGWAIGTVLAGWGVWGLATGVVVRLLSGTVVLNAIGPVRWLRPSWHWSRLRPVLGFGARVQATSALNYVRDQLLIVVVASEAGVSTLGLWALASRALAIPMLLFEALWRVAYPAMTRLMAAGEDTRAILERSVGLVATAGSPPLCALGASSRALVPAIFGARWSAAADPLPLACLGLMIVGPVSVACSGFLAAHGDAGTMLRGALLHTLAQFAIVLPLLPVLHLWAIGLGLLAACLVEAAVLGRRAAALTGARVFKSVAGPLVAGVVGGGAGWMLARSMGHTLVAGGAAAALAVTAYVLVLASIPHNMLRPTLQTMRQALGAAR